MKIGILTHYDVNNQGAQLQMFSLYSAIKQMGHQPFMLSYKKNFDFSKELELRNQVSVKSIPYYLKHFLFEKGIRLTLFNTMKYLKNKHFREENLNFLEYNDETLDVVIVGSDEVYSIPSGINEMMYGYGVKAKTVVSYAPSFGQTDIALLEKYDSTKYIADGLSNCAFLTARDLHTKRMILELTNKDVPIVCDPVILYDFSRLRTSRTKNHKKYLIAYAYDKSMNEEAEVSAIKAFAKKHDLLIFSVGTYHKWCDKNISCDCLQWLHFFKNAEFVITDTFHGAVLSIINQKKMAVLTRELNKNKLVSLMNQFHLQNSTFKKITTEQLESIYKNTYDSKALLLQIEQERKYGYGILEKMIALGEKND